MAQIRQVAEASSGRPVLEGAGVRLRRAVGYPYMPQFDPFLLLDDIHSADPADYRPGFPWHPHRGIETITYLLEGAIAHGDSLGNRGVIHPGAVQWMTAGSGIVHQEMPEGDAGGRVWGLQLWANLPAAMKMTAPRYQGYEADDIPEVSADGARVRVIAGAVNGVRGPVQGVAIAPEYFDVSLPPTAHFTHAVPPGHTAFAYVLDGAGRFDAGSEPVGAGHVVLFTDGETVTVTAETGPARFLFITGKPLHEPVAWRGPIVMNTEAELRQAYAELDAGTFVK